ncbi:MAG: cytochrome C [Desulfobacterales bacterium]|nr:cytochrome C [Desulfobacterales bacterium]MBL7101190.1 cytochrome C [Desulfobacteraceae bacterium]MBL7171919.1 cytochrome C [Desulfobacteraceae bacterium]
MRLRKCVFIMTSIASMITFLGAAQAISSPPIFSVIVAGTKVTGFWSAVEGATGYLLSYAPSPYTGPDTIVTLDMGTLNTISVDLQPGAAYLAAVQARDSTGLSVYSNIEGIKIPQQGSQGYQVFAFNDLGMHCYDSDFSVFSILPLFNVLHAQVIQKGTSPQIVGFPVDVSYKTMADGTGSINTTSIGKTNFWDYVLLLFGLDPPVDQGLLGARMPGADNASQPFHPKSGLPTWFSAEGIPITAVDDNAKQNPYPLMMVQAVDTNVSEIISSLPVVVPASDEMACGFCHATGNEAASLPNVQWSSSTDPTIQYKENILILHDYRTGTNLVNSKPVLCATCHYSLALDLEQKGPVGPQLTNKTMSRATHGYHASRINGPTPSGNICFYCHPGEKTQCQRGAMETAGLDCMNCHGNMSAVGRADRRPWIDLPRCESCHTGDALSNFGDQIIGRTTYTDSPSVATFIIASNKRFAEQTDTLYRNSTGHNGVACESCHGSPHAIWPSRETNDNLAAITIQGHNGTIGECTACHGTGLSLNLNGPHGIHNMNNQAWVDEHKDFFEQSQQACQACHGITGDGTMISKAAADRTFSVEDVGTVNISKGTEIHCGFCHKNELAEGGGD